jgi:hypothetical protein
MRDALLVAAARKRKDAKRTDIRYFRSPVSNLPAYSSQSRAANRHHLHHHHAPCRAPPRHPVARSATSLSRGKFPEGPRTGTPRVYSARRRFLASSGARRSQHMRSPACVW